jgi:type II secretion system protein H
MAREIEMTGSFKASSQVGRGFRARRPAVRECSRFSGASRAFTLIELLLVMTIMVAAIAISGPTLAGFFRGRTLDSEARRMLALVHSGQSRAISEGIPTRLWLDTAQHSYGLEQDPGWSDQDLQIDVVHQDKPRSASSRARVPARVQTKANLRNLPEIRFLPDGSIDDTSPLAFHLQDRSGTSLWLAQATNHLSYEIRDSFN